MSSWRGWVGLGLLCMLAASCSQISLVSDNGKSSAPVKTDNHEVKLEFWHTYSEIETEVFNSRVLPLFEQRFPGIKIHATRKDFTEQLKDNIHAAVADNKQPDVMRMDIIWVPEFAKSGALTDLSAIDGFAGIPDTFIGSLIKTNQYKNKYYGLPVNASTRAAIFNKKLLKEAGLDEPPRTFNELVEAAVRLQSVYPDVYGIGICCSNGWGSLPYFWTFGGMLTDEQYTKADGYLNSEPSKRALRHLKELVDRKVISPSVLGGEPGTWDGILKGQLLMIDDAHWFYTVNETGPNKELLGDVEIGLFPDDVRPGTSVIGGENLVLFDGSRHKPEAWKFIQWMVSEEPQRIMAETGLIPTIRHLQAADLNPLLAPYLEQLARAQPRPPVPVWTEVEDVFARMLERILTGEQQVDDAADRAAAAIDKLLAEY